MSIPDDSLKNELGLVGVLAEVRPSAEPSSGSGTQNAGAGSSVDPAPASLSVQLDVSAAGTLAGGDWLSRANLVSLPSCAMTTPTLKACQTRTPLQTTKGEDGSTFSAVVPLQEASSSAGSSQTQQVSAVIAATAESGGTNGDYKATSLSASGKWTAGGSSGGFSWSYPLRVPKVAGDLVPTLGASYASDAVDGQTSAGNTQTSWLGEGWELGLGSIERQYQTCEDDMSGANDNNDDKRQDLCWYGDNASVKFGAHSGELVQKGTTNQWRLRDDDGTRFEKLKATWENGDNGASADDNEYWKVTTTDGTQYFFGYGRAGAGLPDTNAVLAVPVYGNNPGEPCNVSGFSGSKCSQGYRWNLDHVVDPDGNSLTAYYAKETNYYGSNDNSGDTSLYDRGGYLMRIDYGQRAGAESSKAPAQVLFDVTERCVADSDQTCAAANLKSTTANDWPDVPFDLICTSTSSCPDVKSPVFFTRKRLTAVRTQILPEGTSSYQPVEQWNFNETFPNPGYGPWAMWLGGIMHQGASAASALPEVTFSGTQLPNRVNGIKNQGSTSESDMPRLRLTRVSDEAAGRTEVAYSPGDTAHACTDSSYPTTSQLPTNTKQCFPVYWTPPGAEGPVSHLFYKYTVSSVTQTDMGDASAIPQLTSYTYGGDPAWSYDASKFVKEKRRTWGSWNGYGQVKTVVGDPNAANSLRTDTLYYRGMDGDRLNSSGGTKSVSVTDSQQTKVTDNRAFKGRERERVSYDALNGAVVNDTISDESVVGPVAGTATNADKVTAYLASTTKTQVRTRLSSGTYRTTQTATVFDDYGLPVQVEDLGDTNPAVAGDDTCTRTAYSRLDDTTHYLVNFPKTTKARSGICSAFVDVSADPEKVIEDVTNYYDSSSNAGSIARGHITRVDGVQSVSGNAYVPYMREASSFDSIGRRTAVTDARGKITTTSYTPAGGGVETGSTVTADPDGSGSAAPQSTVTQSDPRWNSPTSSTTPSGAKTEATYDDLGRRSAVWQPGHNRSDFASTPSARYSYKIDKTAGSAVTTQSLNADGTYLTQIDLLDGLMRQRQSQLQALNPGGAAGRLVTDTVYDSRGLPVKSQGPTMASGAPASTRAAVTTLIKQSATDYDGNGRVTRVTQYDRATPLWSTQTKYGGDRTIVIPPAGGTVTTTLLDARGRTTALWQHTGTDESSGHDDSTYTYTSSGKLKTMTDAAGNTWMHTYDLLGREVQSTDPDAGTASKTYDLNGNVLTNKDARGQVLSYEYDDLNRKTKMSDGSGTALAAWGYDAVQPGSQDTSIRYLAGQQIVSKITSMDQAGRPTGQQTVVPVISGWIDVKLAGTYKTATRYNVDGSIATQDLPQLGNVSAEKLTSTYDGANRERTLTGTLASEGAGGQSYGYVGDSDYTAEGQLTYMGSGTPGHYTMSQSSIDPATDRVTDIQFQHYTDTFTNDVAVAYGYNPAGAVTRMSTTQGSVDTQCFSLDHVQRLTEAWTAPDNNCATAKNAPVPGGLAYWRKWSFDKASNRTQEQALTTAGTTTTIWQLPRQGGSDPRPHGATSQAVTSPTGTTTSTAVAYDAIGDVTARTSTAAAVFRAPAQGQTLEYNAEGRLAKATTTGATTPTITNYAYSPDGTRLVRSNDTATTLYFGDNELTLTKATGVLSGTRYYSFAKQTVALRTGNNLADVSTLWSELNNTSNWQVNWSTLAVSTKRTLPYGETRGTVSSTIKGSHGFVNGLEDTQYGFVRLGSRDYDPASGRFLSVDPALDPTQPQQWNPYGYGNGNPLIHPDPTGELPWRPTWHRPTWWSVPAIFHWFLPFIPPPPPPPAPKIAKVPYNHKVNFLTNQMNENSASTFVKNLHQLNTRQSDDGPGTTVEKRTLAKAQWALAVRPKGPWDHKTVLGRDEKTQADLPNEQRWSKLPNDPQKREVYYDVYSNIHYAYVGRQAGFSEKTLTRYSHIPIISGQTDPGDDAALEAGYRLFNKHSDGVTPADVDRAIRAYADDPRAKDDKVRKTIRTTR